MTNQIILKKTNKLPLPGSLFPEARLFVKHFLKNKFVLAQHLPFRLKSPFPYYLLLLFFLLSLFNSCDDKNQPYWDILIKNATIYDGSGAPPFMANIGIQDEHIVFIGNLENKNIDAKKTIDATDYIIAPGFIDPHTHTFIDLNDSIRNSNLNYLLQGVTTVITGNDGNSVNLIGHEFEKLERNGIGTNVAILVGHSNIRSTIMSMSDRAPTDEEMSNMKTLVRRGMEEGAIGFSTGLFYAPSSFASTEEIIELAKITAEYRGYYDTHIRDESSYSIGLLAAMEEAIYIAREANIHLHISHIKCLGVDVWGKSGEVIAMIEDAQQNGASITADQYPYRASGIHLDIALLPKWVYAEDYDYQSKLKHHALSQEIIDGMKENLRRRGGPDALLILSARDEELNGLTLQQVAEEWDMSPIDAALEIMQNGSAGTASFSIQKADIQNFMKRPWVMTGSDGGSGHPRKYGTYPKKIKEYVLEKEVLNLEDMIYKSTALPAQTFGIEKRGKIKEGYFADLIIFKPEELTPHSTYEYPTELAEGMQYVLINGVIVIEKGIYNGSLAGKPIRKKHKKAILD